MKEKFIFEHYVLTHALLNRHITFPCPCIAKSTQYESMHNGMCRLIPCMCRLIRALCRLILPFFRLFWACIAVCVNSQGYVLTYNLFFP